MLWTVKSPNIIGIVVSIVVCRNVWRAECVAIVRPYFFYFQIIFKSVFVNISRKFHLKVHTFIFLLHCVCHPAWYLLFQVNKHEKFVSYKAVQHERKPVIERQRGGAAVNSDVSGTIDNDSSAPGNVIGANESSLSKHQAAYASKLLSLAAASQGRDVSQVFIFIIWTNAII